MRAAVHKLGREWAKATHSLLSLIHIATITVLRDISFFTADVPLSVKFLPHEPDFSFLTTQRKKRTEAQTTWRNGCPTQ